MSILVFDNYDSFTYNLVHAIKKYTSEPVTVVLNDQISLESVNQYDKILLSPGPGIPSETGILLDLIHTYASSKNIFGVCLGHQAIAEALGGTLQNLTEVYHGVSMPMNIIEDDILFKNIPKVCMVGRYHSWAVATPYPAGLVPTAIDADGQLMAFKHKTYNVRGVQFHPESVLTPEGEKMIQNWLELS